MNALRLILVLLLAVTTVWGQSQVPRRSPESRRPTAAPQASRQGFVIEVTEPKDGDIIMGPARIAAKVTADDPTRISQVAFYVDDVAVFIDQEPPYQTVHDFGTSPRRVVVRAVATHSAGFTVESSVVTRELQLGYSVEVRRVVVTLTVNDSQGMPVTGLNRHQFKVYEDDEQQEVLEFNVEQRPLRLGLVLDTSGSMRQQLTEVQLAAAGFLDVLLPEDRAMVVDFDDQVLLLQSLTADRESLRDALMSTYARGGTAMYDAIHATLRRLAPEKERKAIVMLSDGGDSASVMDRKSVLQATRTHDVLIYTIGLGGADQSVLKSLAKEAGGRAFSVGAADELAGVYQRIADELRNQYVLTYASSNPEYDGAWRKLRVDYTGSEDYKVRARRGYYAARTRQRPLEAAPLSVTPAETPEPAPQPADPPLPPAEPAADSPAAAAESSDSAAADTAPPPAE